MLIGRTLARAATRWPENEALVEGDRRLTYREWNRDVNRFARSLRALGVGEGDPVAMFTYNGVEQATTYLAAAKAGAVAVPLNHRLSPGELAYLLDAAGAELLVYDPDLIGTVRDAKGDLETIRGFVATADAADLGRPFDDLLDGDAAELDADPVPDATAVMMHTSGTTGRPKLVELTQRGQWINSLSCAVELDYDDGDRALNIAPLYHSAGYLNLFLPVLHVGGTNVIQRTFDAGAALDLIDRERITTTLGVPTQYQRFRKAGVEAPPETLRLAAVSGAPLQRDVIDWVTEHLCPRFVNVYGLTESTGFVTILDPDDLGRMDEGYCIGEPFLNVDVRAVEIGDDVPPDATVADGERGQLVARAEKVMRGYYGRPGATAEALRDGWLYTGDVVVRREGFYYLVDRVDNMIISGGENLYPAEVERTLDDHPGIEESAVVGESDPDLGERVMAYVVPADPSLTAADVEAYWRGRDDIADFKRPRAVEFVDHIPKNPSGKIVRHELPR